MYKNETKWRIQLSPLVSIKKLQVVRNRRFSWLKVPQECGAFLNIK